MSQYLPLRWFKWLTKFQIDAFDVNKVWEVGSKDCIVEVDFVYPEELHDLHNDYPLTPEELKSKKVFGLIITKILKVSVIFQFVESNNLYRVNKNRYVLHY